MESNPFVEIYVACRSDIFLGLLLLLHFCGHIFELWSKVKSAKKQNKKFNSIAGRESISRGRSEYGQTVEWF